MMHKTKTVELNGEKVKIDNNIVELILILNQYTDLKTRYCCENNDDKGTIYILLDESVTDKQVLEFRKENEEINSIWSFSKVFTISDQEVKSVLVWQIEIKYSENYNTILDILYNKYTDKIFFYNYIVHKIDNVLPHLFGYIIFNTHKEFEEKEYNRNELLEEILCTLDKDKSFVIHLNNLWYVKNNDNEWVYKINRKEMEEYIKYFV